MRMWLCDPKILCQKHLCGEHVETHMFLGTLKKSKKINGYLNNNLFEPLYLRQRHEELKNEMKRRGYNHNSDMLIGECLCIFNLSDKELNWKVDKEKSLKDLLDRCPKCYERFKRMKK